MRVLIVNIFIAFGILQISIVPANANNNSPGYYYSAKPGPQFPGQQYQQYANFGPFNQQQQGPPSFFSPQGPRPQGGKPNFATGGVIPNLDTYEPVKIFFNTFPTLANWYYSNPKVKADIKESLTIAVNYTKIFMALDEDLQQYIVDIISAVFEPPEEDPFGGNSNPQAEPTKPNVIDLYKDSYCFKVLRKHFSVWHKTYYNGNIRKNVEQIINNGLDVSKNSKRFLPEIQNLLLFLTLQILGLEGGPFSVMPIRA